MGLEEPSWQSHSCWLESLVLPLQAPPHDGSLSRRGKQQEATAPLLQCSELTQCHSDFILSVEDRG